MEEPIENQNTYDAAVTCQSAYSEAGQLGFRTIGRCQESSRVLRHFIEVKGLPQIYIRSVSFEKNRSGLEIQLMAIVATPRHESGAFLDRIYS